jgi:hypothetical protein
MSCKDIRKVEHGKQVTPILRRKGFDVWNGSNHTRAKHPHHEQVLCYPNKKLSRGVKGQLIKALVAMGMAGLILAIIYMYT